MKPNLLFTVFALLLLLPACVGARRQGHSRYDAFESAQIDQMLGNAVSGRVFERTVVCLNARRETRPPTPVTNQTISLLTNLSVSYVTNLVVTVVTNLNRTVSTNVVPPAPRPAVADEETERVEPDEAAEAPSPTPSTPGPSTNRTVTVASTASLSRGPNQTVSNQGQQMLLSLQTTITTNNLSITLTEQETTSVETNLMVTTVTNQTVTAATNVTVTLPPQPLSEHYLVVEFTPPPDFTLQSGESLVLLVDGVRHGLAQTNTSATLVTRKGFASVAYRVSSQLLEDIAQAKEVKLRLKGTTGLIQKKLSARSRRNFKTFLHRHPTPETLPAQAHWQPDPGAASL